MTISLSARGITAGFIPDCGFLAGLTVTDQGRSVAPMHRAPWLGQAVPPGSPPHHAGLQGDFFCAPFSDASADGAPLHGWAANAHWTVADHQGHALRAVLDRPVMGARLEKHLSVRDGHPFVYQRHVFHGGAGRIAAANHAMVSLPDGGRIAMSPKACLRTPATAPESDPARGRSALRYPATGSLHAFPGARGMVDLSHYPFGPAHEDFVLALEPASTGLVWTCVVRPAQGDAYLSLRRADEGSATMLWHSNGGRDYAPWSGRHRGCLGVEEGFHGPLLGEADRRDLVLGGKLQMRHVTGAFVWPSGQAVVSVVVDGDTVVVTGEGGAVRRLGYDPGHLQQEGGQ